MAAADPPPQNRRRRPFWQDRQPPVARPFSFPTTRKGRWSAVTLSKTFLSRGRTVRLPLIVDFSHRLPEQNPDADPRRWAQVFRKALAKFKKAVASRYDQSTLERLLHSPVAEVRQATVLALGLTGTMRVNE